MLEGIVSRSTPEGLTVSMHFFHDVFVPADKLPCPSKLLRIFKRYKPMKFSHENLQIWSWEYSTDEDNGGGSEADESSMGGNVTSFFMDPGKRVR